MRAVAVALLLLFTGISVSMAQSYLVDGRVTDIHGNPLAFVPVYIKGTSNGSIANEQGVYQLKVQPGSYTLVFRVIGYEQQTVPLVVIDQNVKLNMKLEPESYTLESYLPQDTEVDSALVIMQQVIARRVFYLNQVKEYSCDIYLKANQKLISAPRTFFKADVAKVLNLDAERKGTISLFESFPILTFAGQVR